MVVAGAGALVATDAASSMAIPEALLRPQLVFPLLPRKQPLLLQVLPVKGSQ